MSYDKTDYEPRLSQIKELVAQGLPKSEIARIIGCKAGKINSLLTKHGIVYTGNQGMRGLKQSTSYKTAEEYLGQGKYVSSHKLRKKLLKDGIKEHRCEICETTEWMGKPVPLELDHIDGNHFNNELDNLRIICPNCHAQTDTHAGKKNKKQK